MSDWGKIDSAALDRYITGHWGEDQFSGADISDECSEGKHEQCDWHPDDCWCHCHDDYEKPAEQRSGMDEQEAVALATEIVFACGKDSGAWVSLAAQDDGTYTVWLHFVGQDEFLSRAEYEQWRDGAGVKAHA